LQEQGISTLKRGTLLRGSNNAMPATLGLAFGEEYQAQFIVLTFTNYNFDYALNLCQGIDHEQT
jgi:hypothetical protein